MNCQILLLLATFIVNLNAQNTTNIQTGSCYSIDYYGSNTYRDNISQNEGFDITQELIDNHQRIVINVNKEANGYVTLAATNIQDKEIVVYCKNFVVTSSFKEIKNTKILVYAQELSIHGDMRVTEGSRVNFYDDLDNSAPNDYISSIGVGSLIQTLYIYDNSEVGIFVDDQLSVRLKAIVGKTGFSGTPHIWNPFDYSALNIRSYDMDIHYLRVARRSRSHAEVSSQQEVFFNAYQYDYSIPPLPFQKNTVFTSEELNPNLYGGEVDADVKFLLNQSRWSLLNGNPNNWIKLAKIIKANDIGSGAALVGNAIGSVSIKLGTNFDIIPFERNWSACAFGHVIWDHSAHGFGYYNCGNYPPGIETTSVLDEYCNNNLVSNPTQAEKQLTNENSIHPILPQTAQKQSIVNVYPNPAKDVINIAIQSLPVSDAFLNADNLRIGLINAHGNTIADFSEKNIQKGAVFQFDVSRLPSGSYFIVFQSEHLYEMQAVIIE